MSKPSVYLETSVVSYLVGWLSRSSLLVASNQELTRELVDDATRRFELFASTAVMDEARKGQAQLPAERLQFLREVQLLDVTKEARELAAKFVREAQYRRKPKSMRSISPSPRSAVSLTFSRGIARTS